MPTTVDLKEARPKKKDRKKKKKKKERFSRKRERVEKTVTEEEAVTKQVAVDKEIFTKEVIAEVHTPSFAETVEASNKKCKVIKKVDVTGEKIHKNLRLVNFRISQGTIDNLEAKGIKLLFEIQAATFDIIFNGNDVLSCSRTGTDKILAFALSVIEKLSLDTGYKECCDRSPRVLVLYPIQSQYLVEIQH